MDDYFFKNHVKACRNVSEDTSYLEIFNYSGAFTPPKLKDGVELLNGCRIVLQLKVKHPETFAPHVISFTGPEYENMVQSLHLPYRAIEGTAVVGPFFWSSYDSDDDDDPYQQIIMRKSDVRKKGKTRGWELMLSHRFRTGITTGYVKGTDSSDMTESVQHLKECAPHMAHPFLLPMIILSHDLSPKTDSKQRDARDWLRRLEHAVSMRNEIQEEEGYVKADVMDLDQINRDLVECHSQVLWKRPQAYQEIINAMKEGMKEFEDKLPEKRGRKALEDGGKDMYGYRDLRKQQSSMLSRLDFYYNKLKGTEHYVHTTLERLAIQRSALYNIIAQKESKLNLQMAGDQRRLAYASKRDSTSMKTISLLGSIFLPATLLASIFSMTFFNFQNGLANDDDGPIVAPTFWIYFAVAIPITLFIVIIWWIWDRSREARYAKEDDDLEANIEHMEKNIMKTMRQRTMSKVRTWTHAPEKVE